MSEPSQAAPAGAGELHAELHRFLSLEAPFLISLMPDGGSDEDVEAGLLGEIQRLMRPADSLADDEIYPSVTAGRATGWRRRELEVAIRGFFRRRRIRGSLTQSERRLMFRTMLLTRAVDDFLKTAFDRKEIAWQDYPSPQKGFRSTGQEAIVGAALRLRRPPVSTPGPEYDGDYIAPLIRDLGAALMFMPDPRHPMLVQYGKIGTPVGGRDLHVGDIEHGVLPPAAPLAIATQTMVGMAHALKLRGSDQVCVSFIGDGGASLGEWHEAINFAAVRRLGLVFVIENNQWALGTHVSEQSRAHRFALRAAGYGIPAATLYGNDPEEVAAGVSWAAERARAGEGPTLIELISYRRPGHAHHDDDRFHGSPGAGIAGYENDDERKVWEGHDPIELYEERL